LHICQICLNYHLTNEFFFYIWLSGGFYWIFLV
jgi:hypothetical protein